MARPKRQWTAEEDAVLALYPSKNFATLALELRAGIHCIRRRLVELGIQIRKPNRPARTLPKRKESDFGSDEHYYGTDMKT